MRKLFLSLGAVMFCALGVLAQTPYDNFAPEQSVKSMIELSDMQFKVTNTDPNSEIRSIEFDKNTHSVNLLNDNGNVFKSIQLNSDDKKFTTMDPLAEKYYSISPYAYCANNPINAVDFNGDSITITQRTGILSFLGIGKKQTVTYENGKLYNKDGSTYTGKVNGFLAKAVGGLNDLRNTTEGNSIVSELQSSSNIFDIQKGSKNEFEDSNRGRAVSNLIVPGSSKGSGGIIRWNPNSTSGGLDVNGGRERASYIGLGHEMAHASDANKGVLDFRVHDGLAVAEWDAVYRENLIRGQVGVPARSYYAIDISTGIPVGVGPNLFKDYLYKQLIKAIQPTIP